MENRSFIMFLKKYWFKLLGIIALCWVIYYGNTHKFTPTLADEVDITQTKFEVIDSVLFKECSQEEWYSVFSENKFTDALINNDEDIIKSYISSSMLAKYGILVTDIRNLHIEHTTNTNKYSIVAQIYTANESFKFVLSSTSDGNVLLCADDLVNADSPIQLTTDRVYSKMKPLYDTLVDVDGKDIDCQDIVVYTDATQTSGYYSEVGLFSLSDVLQNLEYNTGITYLRQYDGDTKDKDYLENFGRIVIDFTHHKTNDRTTTYYAKLSLAIYNTLCEKYGCDYIYNLQLVSHTNNTRYFLGKNIYNSADTELTLDMLEKSIDTGYVQDYEEYYNPEESDEEIKVDVAPLGDFYEDNENKEED